MPDLSGACVQLPVGPELRLKEIAAARQHRADRQLPTLKTRHAPQPDGRR